ncbi:guanine nucleotide exchange factor VAV2-like isoform X2 [Babylonia areolata]|uniref:guanine nucleotide exchange factor VAV2-like isoform X2 n=1 Tax=Babylonia areolata TaxID=304850 RepID=UPI003FCFC48F
MAAEEWRQCVDWLVQCQILPSDHKATSRDSTAFDLAQALRDGVLICHLLNQLCPGSVDPKDFSPRPQMSQFLCLKNIRTFLHACSKTFGLREHELFDPHDLFDVKDFRKILEVLSKLSKSERAQQKYRCFGPQASGRVDTSDRPYYNDLERLAMGGGFPPDTQSQLYDDDKDIYGNLQELAIENDLEDQEDIYDVVYQEDEDKIYDDLCYRRDPNRRQSSTVLAQPKTRRDHCVKELIDTEKNYVDALDMIVTHFIKPLQTQLPPRDIELIFARIEPMLEVHRGFKTELNSAVVSGTPRLSDVFIRYKTKLLVYGDFCSNLPRAQKRIDELCQNDALRLKIQECEIKANEGKFRLRDLLHVPMQRVLKYHLLLRELIKNTDRSDDDRSNLELALEAMQDLSLYVNEVKRDHEALQLIEEIQESINDLKMPTNTSLKDYGRFQKDGELKVLSHQDSRVRNRHIFLFDKVMLMCKARGELYSFKDAIVLGEYKTEDNPVPNDKKGEKWNYSFIMVKLDKRMAFTFFAKTEEQRQKWLEAIALALDNTQPAAAGGSRSYVMHTFSKPKECDVCGKLLRGIFFQGYLCQEKQMAVHKECIGKQHQAKKPRPVRPTSDQNLQTPFKGKAVQGYRGVPSPPAGMRPVLCFDKDAMLDVVAQPHPDWCRGRCSGEEGYFPSRCVVHALERKGSYVHVKPGAGGRFEASPPPPAPHSVANGPDYVNDPASLQAYNWYVGVMERPMAQKQLDSCPDGTFLIRVTNNPQRRGELSLSIKYANAVRHIKVNRTPQGLFYLADGHYFESIQSLVQHYEKNELSDIFPDVTTTLRIPYKTSGGATSWILGYAVAVYDYAATSTSQVTMKLNDRIAILSKNGQDKGWWKGENLRTKKIGYFPLAYVDEED